MLPAPLIRVLRRLASNPRARAARLVASQLKTPYAEPVAPAPPAPSDWISTPTAAPLSGSGSMT